MLVLTIFAFGSFSQIAEAGASAPNLLDQTLVGTWFCRGRDLQGGSISGSIGWSFEGASVLRFFASLSPETSVDVPIDEVWSYDDVLLTFVSDPRPGAVDRGRYVSDGWKDDVLDWVQQTPAAPLERRFLRLPQGRLAFQVHAVSDPNVSGYTIMCNKRGVSR